MALKKNQIQLTYSKEFSPAMPITYVAHTVVGPFSFNTYVKGSYLSGCYCQESSSSAYTTNPLTILLLLHLDSLFLARYGGGNFKLNYRLKFFSFFLFLSASRIARSRQATQRISINYPRLRFPRSQAVLKERGRPGGTDGGSGGALELGDEEKRAHGEQCKVGVGRPASASLDLDRLPKLPWIFSVSIGLLLPFLWAFHLLAVRELNLILFQRH